MSPIKIAINGFGRIGRQITRLLLAHSQENLRLVAVNTLDDIATSAFLLKHDSTHGTFTPQISVQGNLLQVNGCTIPFYRQPEPDSLPWKELGVDIVIECSGNCTLPDLARGHIRAGAKKTIITAATANPDITLCIGVNHTLYQPEKHQVISASSCTTNCLTPVLAVLDKTFSIQAAMATFLHSYTGGQPLLDNPSKDLRRSRNALTNIIPTSTSAEEQVAKILPQLKGKFQALAIRLPTPVIHLADLTVTLAQPVSIPAVHEALSRAAQESMQGIISLNNAPLVSRDYRGSQYSSVVDVSCTQVSANMLKLFIWHDNEVSYSRRIIDLISFLSTTLAE